MRTLILTSCCVALLGAAGASIASEPAKPATAVQADTTAKVPAKAEAPRSNCAAQTGTRLALNGKHCSSSPTRSYTGEQLFETGEMNTAAALKKLDPALL